MDDHQTALTADVLAYLQQSSQSPLHNSAVKTVQTLSGDQNALWRVQTEERDVVVKMFLDAGQARGRRQFHNQETAAQLGAAPPPIAFDRYPVGLSRQVMLYHWDPGLLLDPTDAAQRQVLAQALVQVHTRAPSSHTRLSPHPVSPDYQWNLMQGSQRQLEAWLAVQPANDLTAALQRILAGAGFLVQAGLADIGSATPALVHGDIYPEHCLVDTQGLRFVDWELGGLGDPAREVAHVLIHVLRGIPEMDRQIWLDQYLTRMQDPSLDSRIRLYELMLPVAACMDLALHLLAGDRDMTAQAGSRMLLQLAFQECLMDVSRVLDLDLAEDEITCIAHIYHSQLGQPVPLYPGAHIP